jgi:aryl-alcohol dehydrogenase-like predicted oxidoreductase
MQTDYVDILQFHFSPAKAVLEQEDALATLQELKQQGKIRFLGCSSMLPHLTDHIEMGVFDVLQIPYSALQPEHETAIAEAAKAGAGIVIRGGVARGEPGAGQGLAELLEGISATAFMLRFTITSSHTHTTIVGTLSPAHLHENVAAVLQGSLPTDVYHEAKRRLRAARATPA